MIYRVRTISLVPEKAGAVRDVATRAAAYVNTHYSEISVEVLENVTGPLRVIHMVTCCPSLAALESYEEMRKSDQGWLDLVAEVDGIGGTSAVEDHLYRTI